MTSAVNIANRALSKLGTQKTISDFTGSSPASVQCGLWYDTVRRALLRTAPWGFARQQLVLTQMGDAFPDQTSPYPYLYMYAYPADCLKLRYVLPVPPSTTTQTPVPSGTVNFLPLRPRRDCRFIVANNPTSTGGADPTITNQRVILTNVPNAIGVYTYNAIDPNQFDPLFEVGLISALAAELVMPLSGNAGMVQSFRQDAEDKIMRARAADGNEAIPKTDHTPDWIATRMVGGYDYNPYQPDGWGQWYSGYDDMSWGM